MCAQKRDFSIIFRTFGADILEVVDEMNMFATGQHPCYPEVTPSACAKTLSCHVNASDPP